MIDQKTRDAYAALDRVKQLNRNAFLRTAQLGLNCQKCRVLIPQFSRYIEIFGSDRICLRCAAAIRVR
jgi:hypothetical protein